MPISMSATVAASSTSVVRPPSPLRRLPTLPSAIPRPVPGGTAFAACSGRPEAALSGSPQALRSPGEEGAELAGEGRHGVAVEGHLDARPAPLGAYQARLAQVLHM